MWCRTLLVELFEALIERYIIENDSINQKWKDYKLVKRIMHLIIE